MALELLLALVVLWTVQQSGECQLQFVQPVYTVVVPETPANDSDVPSTPSTPSAAVTVATTCTGSGTDPSSIRYSLREGESTVGTIHEATGVFSLSVETLDYERQPEYTVSLFCYLFSDPNVNATAPLIIIVTPINEYLPTIYTSNDISRPYSFPETTPPGIRIAAVDPIIGAPITYSASDRDGGQDGVILFSLVDVGQELYFDLERSTGTLLLAAALDIDALEETSQSYNIRIAACNEHIDVSNCDSLSFTVIVTAANDIAPQFEPPIYPVSLLESTPIGSLVTQPLCVDRDYGTGNSVTISFYSGTSETALETFLLSSAGNVELQTTLDYEEGPVNYQLQLTCSDGIHQATAQVLVDVLPVNDNLPSFLQDRYEFTADRSSPVGSTVGQVEAEDEDIDTGGNITYSLDDTLYFSIDSTTGEIKIRDHILSSAGSQFQLEVFATDGEFSSNASVSVSIRGALSQPEFAGIVAGILIFILLVVTVLFLVGVCGCCYIRATRRSAYAVDRATLSADVTPSQKVVRFADDEFSRYFRSPSRPVVLSNQSAGHQSLPGGDLYTVPKASSGTRGSQDEGRTTTVYPPEASAHQHEETSFVT